MAYENIRLRKQNMAVYGGYFWMVDDDLDVLVVKTDDGTTAFTYPLDTNLTATIYSIEYDGYNLWTLEQTTTTSICIRRWKLVNYICKLADTFNFVETGSDKFNAEAFAVERYTVSFSSYEGAGQNTLSITDGASAGTVCSKIPSGGRIILGPNAQNQTEEFIVLQGGMTDTVKLSGITSYAYEAGDPIRFYTNFWIFNNYYGILNTTGALYQADPFTGSVINKYSGNEFKDIKAACFFGLPYFVFNSGASIEPYDYSICFVKSTNIIFLDPSNVRIALGSMVMDNIESNLSTVIPVYDIGMYAKNIYRLQLKATYYGVTGTFANSTYNYQLSTFNKIVTSIAVSSDPAILPADGVSESSIVAVVRDQFNQPVVGRTVVFTDDDSGGVMTSANVDTDSEGRAPSTYRAGIEAREVRIVATCQQS